MKGKLKEKIASWFKKLKIDTTGMSEEEIRLLKKKRVIGLASVGILILFFVLVWIFIGKPLVNTLSEPEEFRQMVQDKGIWGKLIMIGITALQVVVAIIPGEPFEIGAGYAFGIIEGTILCLIGSALSAALIFLLVKKLGRRFVELFVSKEEIESWKWMKNKGRLKWTVFLLYLIPGTPKDVLVYLCGLTPISTWDFVWLTTVARIPSVISSAIFGAKLSEQQYVVAGIVYGITGVLTLAGLLIYKKHQSKLQESGSQGDDSPTE